MQLTHGGQVDTETSKFNYIYACSYGKSFILFRRVKAYVESLRHDIKLLYIPVKYLVCVASLSHTVRDLVTVNMVNPTGR